MESLLKGLTGMRASATTCAAAAVGAAAFHGVLTGKHIFALMRADAVRISPYNPAHLTNVAYDVTLGNDAYFVQRPGADYALDASSKDSVRDSWILVEPKKAAAPMSSITLAPGESVLCHTHEFIGGMPGQAVTTMLRARSSIAGRAGVSVSASGGWGDIGFNSRWTMLITNHRACQVALPFGMRIAQIVFLCTSGNDESYAEKGGSYGLGGGDAEFMTFEQLLSKWSPYDMVGGKPSVA
jgi:deoxycytidine triphosphate deaminase